MSLVLKMWITVNMECLTERELGFGITLQLENQNHYVIRTAATSGITNILKQHNGYHQKPKQTGETIQKYINRKTYIKDLVV